MRLCQWNRYFASVTCKKKSVDDDEILTLPYKSDVLFHIKNPILDPTTFEYATDIGTQTLHIGQVNNAKIITPAYVAITPKRSILTRGKETTPTTLMIEMVPKTASAGRKYVFINGESGLNQFLNYVVGYLVFREFGTSNYGTIVKPGSGLFPMDTTKKYIVALTYNGDKMSTTPLRLYYNGVEIISTLEKTVTEVMEFANTGTAMSIGNTVSGLEFQFTRATAWDVELSATDIANCNFDCNETDKVIDILATEGNGATVYNLLETGNNGTITNATLSSVWGTPSDVFTPHNEIRGFSLYKNDSDPTILIRVPYKNDGTPNISSLSGYTKISENPAGAWFNDSESKFKFEDETVGSDLMNSDGDKVFWGVDGVAKWFDLNSLLAMDGTDRTNNAGFAYINKLDTKLKKQFTIYKTDKVLTQDIKVLKWHKMGSKIIGEFDHNYHAKLEE